MDACIDDAAIVGQLIAEAEHRAKARRIPALLRAQVALPEAVVRAGERAFEPRDALSVGFFVAGKAGRWLHHETVPKRTPRIRL